MKQKFKEIIHKLIHLNSSPPEIALGVAIGAFICIIPLYGFHTLMVVIFALLIPKANKIAILVGTNLSLPPTLPTITWTAYDIGRYVLPQIYPPLSWEYFKHFDFKKIGDFYYPLFVGSVILGLLSAGIAYLITYFVVKKWQKNHGMKNTTS